MKRLRFIKKDYLKNLSTYQRNNLISILICLFFVMSLSIGYAYISQRFDINGEVYVRATKDIRITSIGDFTSINEGYEKYNPKYDINNITTNVSLPNISSYVSYNVTIANNGTAAMKIKSITPTSSNDSMTYDLTGVNVGNIISGIDSVTFTIKLRYSSLVTEVPNNIDYSLILNFEFEEYIPKLIDDYVKDDLLLDLRGVDAPTNNKWTDHTNSNNVITLTNTTYDSEAKKYNFGNNSYGDLGKTIIPETGTFTLEVYMKTPTSFINNDDQAIISQVNNTDNDLGRFKFNYTYKNKQANLLIFANETYVNNNTYHYFLQSAIEDTKYCMQLVRTNSKLELYLNGRLVTTSDFPSSNKISQTNFKIGKWNNKALQYFTGSIYAIRLYNRVLTANEIAKNYEIDQETYKDSVIINPPPATQYSSIFEYALNEDLVTIGDGLYNNTDSYSYKGTDPSNYLKFNGSEDIYRIISFENDGSMKLINISSATNIPFDESGKRDSTTSLYCDSASKIADKKLNQYYGCNAWNQSENVLIDASINKYLNNTYYNSLPNNIKTLVLKHDFYNGFVKDGTGYNTTINNLKSSVWNGNIGLLSVLDLYRSTSETPSVNSSQTIINSWITALSSKTKGIWTMNASSSNTWDIQTVINGNLYSKRRASRFYQEVNANQILYFYAMPSFYVKSNLNYSGTGTFINPFVIG